MMPMESIKIVHSILWRASKFCCGVICVKTPVHVDGRCVVSDDVASFDVSRFRCEGGVPAARCIRGRHWPFTLFLLGHCRERPRIPTPGFTLRASSGAHTLSTSLTQDASSVNPSKSCLPRIRHSEVILYISDTSPFPSLFFA